MSTAGERDEKPAVVFDAARAIAFVAARADPSERERLRALLAGEKPSEATADAVLAGQRADGGYAPFWAPDYSGLDATCFRLALAEQLGVTPAATQDADASPAASPAAVQVARALAFIAARQQPDGTWQEDVTSLPASAAVPPWLTPGDAAAALYLTANCGYWLGALGGADYAGPAMAAADAIERELTEDGRLPSFPHSYWLAAGLLHRADRTLAAARVLDRLRMAILPDVTASGLAWLVTCLAAAGVPAHHPTVRSAVQRLGPLQQPDGRWRSDDGPARDVHATLEALRALRWFGRARARLERAFIPEPSG
ncbi:MAG TPA: prenyltransferase/squalene oxidase repeat-containing protein [Chloroflexota bacterium]|nr:prenyltransferase/squalene oxidase repeat-containing protein [Chloroflexota bacterium]